MTLMNAHTLFAGWPWQAMLADGFFTRLFFRKGGASDHAADVDNLYLFIWWVSIASFVLLMGLMVYFVFKYRRVPGEAAQRSASHHTLLELTWSIVPLLFMTVMFFWGFKGYTKMVVAPADAEVLMLNARKWVWTVTYPNGAQSLWTTQARNFGVVPANLSDKVEIKAQTVQGGDAYPVFVIPAGRATKFQMISEDVLHSFWVPDFRIKFDVFPNRYTAVWIEPEYFRGEKQDHKGRKYDDHWVMCAEYCGDKHSEMLAVLRVMSEADYRSALEEYATPTGTPAERGEKISKSKGCFSCHSVDGSKNTGPTWKNNYGYAREFTSGPGMNDAQSSGEDWLNYIRDSIYVPGAKVKRGYPNQMVSYHGQLSDEQVYYISEYIKSLSDRASSHTHGEPAAADPAAAPAAPDATAGAPK
jgi:cytochrome c oxidase subunit II